jgi:50S ribosomal protein L16 3-hydroxylase
MDITQALPLLGGISPERFMKQYWQKKPLLIRQAIPGMQPLLERAALFDLAASEDVASRLIEQVGSPQHKTTPTSKTSGWRMRHGPFERRALPALKKTGWTLLVQGVNVHHQALHALMQQFRFVPDARLDDVMISYASDGGGVGPHFDSYDVFLLQAQGQRRWQISAQKDLTLQEGAPLKILADFKPEQTWVLEPGDMLYLPPRYAHDGVAVGGDCMTYSVGFRAPKQAELGQELLQRLAEDLQDDAREVLYQDKHQAAVSQPACMPEGLQDFARQALARAMQDPHAIARLLGEYLTEPKAQVWFEEALEPVDLDEQAKSEGVQLDRRTRMLYDERHVFINGESYLASGRDAQLMRQLADEGALSARAWQRASPGAKALMQDWCDSGWLCVGGGN